MYEYHAEVLEVIEADALHLQVDLGLDTRKQMISLLAGVRSPHLGEPGRDRAVQIASAWVWNRSGHVLLHTIKQATSEAGRYRVEVLDYNGFSLADALINCGVGVRLAA